MDNSEIFHLLANPTHIKKKKVLKADDFNKELDEDIIQLLKKRFDGIYLTDNDTSYILEKIETFIFDISNKNIIKEILNSIINSIVSFDNE
jgi:hypothetical protein